MLLSATVVVACSLLSTTPIRHVAIDQVELIEYNHFYDEQGRHVFDQMLFYDWSARDARYQIRDWRLIKTTTQTPYYDAQRGFYVATWHDGLTLRQVRAGSIRETWTQYDPELTERSVLPKEHRRELSDIRKVEQLFSLPVSTGSP
jgi:hypothetical protein